MKRVISMALTISLIACTFTGCGNSKTTDDLNSAMSNKVDIALSINQVASDKEKMDLDWVELDQLKSFESFRNSMDYSLNTVKFDKGSKNGVVYIDENGNWTGNSVLLNAFKNKEFVNNYWNNARFIEEVTEFTKETFSDVKNEDVAMIAALNTYFNILPCNADGTSGLYNYLTRREVMTAIYRADTPVIMQEASEYDDLFGQSDYNFFADKMEDCSYLKTDNNSLNAYTYNTVMTRAEAVYMIVQRYFKDEYDKLGNTSVVFSDCKNGGDILGSYNVDKGYSWQLYSLEASLQNPELGLDESLYKALVVAYKHGIIGSTTKWNQGIMYGELLTMIIKAYDSMYDNSNYPVNARTGFNEGNQLEIEVEEPEKEEENLGDVEIGDIIEADEIDEVLIKYADLIDMTDEQIERLKRDSEGYTFELVDKHMTIHYCTYLNVRSGPGVNYTMLKSIPVGTEVHIIARCIENDWYRVITDGVVAYQCGAYFSDD